MVLEKLIVYGGRPLRGTVKVSGSKNASLPIMAATLLADGPCTLGNIPRLRDVDVMARILQTLGVEVERGADGRLACRVVSEDSSLAPYELVSMMRGSICVLGPLLAKRGYAKVSLPGGCVIGARPIDLHLKGLRALGAEIKIEHGYVVARAKRLRGANIYLGGPAGSSVLGTANVLCAAVPADGVTVLEHASCEPEIVDLANFLIAMGASIEGVGSHRLTVRGVRRLYGCDYEVLPDRIAAGTYLAAAAITHGEVSVEGVRPSQLEAVFDVLSAAGVSLVRNGHTVTASLEGRPREVDVTTLPYPGFPTDLQAQITALLCLGNGASVITEKIYPDRFMHVAELNRMGARILRLSNTAVVVGREKLQGAPVMASDLRASAALVLAGLAAEGETHIRRIYHLDRGYENLEGKLRALGAQLERAEDEMPEKPPVL